MSVAAAASHHSEAHHGAVDWPKDSHVGTASVGKVGMWIFLLSDALSFAGLLLAYGIARGSAEIWRHTTPFAEKGWPAEPILGINFTAVLTFLLICSSVTMVLAHAAAVEGNRKQLVRYLALTAIGGALFLTGQMQEYFGIFTGGHGLIAEGLVFGRSAYATTFYIITGFHGMHVFTGVTYITVMLIRSAMGKYDGGKHDHIEILGLFWHFVDLIWIIVFTLVYLIPL
jgi:heme/copper-type cytochrome/quinol oxidase subunit 3